MENENKVLELQNENQLSAIEIQDLVSGLSPAAEALFYFLPEICWMTEKTMAKALKTHQRVISASKRELEEAGLVKIERKKGNYSKDSELHIIVKVTSESLLLIPKEYLWVLKAKEMILSPLKKDEQSKLDSFVPYNPVPFSMNWELLQKYSATEINRFTKLEQAELYMEVGFLVLPTNYPTFTNLGKAICSCRHRDICFDVGKHPAVNDYKNLTPESYSKMKGYILKRFKKNPDLNIGFKVWGFSVVDVDYKNGGAYTLEWLREQFGGLDETLTAQSPNGLHLYTSTRGFNQSSGLLGAGIDIRSDKTTGFIVAPCSTHKSGRDYIWKEINELQPIPGEWLYESRDVPRKNKGKETGRKIKDIKLPIHLESDYLILVGERNDTLYKWACRFRGRGADESQIYDELVALRDTFCEESINPKDALTDNELRNIAKSASGLPTNAEKLLSKAA